MQLNNISTENNYDAYIIQNQSDKELLFPKNCVGAIGITIDDKVKSFAHYRLSDFTHLGIKLFNTYSAHLNNVETNDKLTGIDITDTVHAFVVTNLNTDKTELKVCETNQHGIGEGSLKQGDNRWSSMVLFVPKNEAIRSEIVLGALAELRPDSDGDISSYGFVPGMISVLSKRMEVIPATNTAIIATEASDLIRGNSIKSNDGTPLEAICSQLALRILRGGTIIGALSPEKVRKYEKLGEKEIIEKLMHKMTKENSSLAKAYNSSQIFQLDANMDILPYELFRTLIAESEIHPETNKS